MVKQPAPHPKLQGKTKRLSNQEVTVTIPFNNGELEAKFNEFFNPTSKKNSEATSKATELPNIDSQMSLTQNNLLFLLRNRLSYAIRFASLAHLNQR